MLLVGLPRPQVLSTTLARRTPAAVGAGPKPEPDNTPIKSTGPCGVVVRSYGSEPQRRRFNSQPAPVHSPRV